MEKASKKEFVERVLDDNVVGDYDNDGFFVTPNGCKYLYYF